MYCRETHAQTALVRVGLGARASRASSLGVNTRTPARCDICFADGSDDMADVEGAPDSLAECLASEAEEAMIDAPEIWVR